MRSPALPATVEHGPLVSKIPPPTLADIQRLTTQRGLEADDALARLAVQMDNGYRASIVDRVIWNDGTIDDLYRSVDVALEELMAHD